MEGLALVRGDLPCLGGLGLWPQNVELLRGVVIEKPSKTPLHTYLCEEIAAALRSLHPAQYVVRLEQPLSLRDSEPEPDLAVVRGQRSDYRNSHPTSAVVVVEVSISTEEWDRAKGSLYAESGVAEFWLVCPAAATVELFRRPTQGQHLIHETLGPEAVLVCEALGGFQLPLKPILGAV